METLPNQTPAAQEPKKKESSLSGVALALIALAALLIFGATALFVLRRPNQPTMPAVSDIKTDTKTPTTTNTIPPTTQVPTTTIPVTTTPTATPVVNDNEKITLGETFQIFKGDTITINLPNQTNPRWSVKALSFGDSRCPEGVQCIWAGEQNVTLTITDLVARVAPQDITLGTARNTSQTLYGLTLKLKTIEDGKGGTYAEIETK